MSGYDKNTVQALRDKIQSQQKTIDVLMDMVETYSRKGLSSLELLSENHDLEKIVERKTRSLEEQGEELRKTVEELQAAQAQLVQACKLKAVGQLAAGIAHEVNSPIQFVGSNIQFLSDSFVSVQRIIDEILQQFSSLVGGKPLSKAAEFVQTVLEDEDWTYLSEEIPSAIAQSRDGVERIATIVQAMKEFSHPSGKHKEMADMNRMIETTVTVARNVWKYCAEVETDFEKDLPLVPCLVNEMGQVVLNLIINGAHAIEEKNDATGSLEKGVLKISTRVVGECVEIRISDSGGGIPEDIRSRVFEPFFTTKQVGKGTGQGLMIAHDVVVNKHGGTIDFITEIGRGTTFLIQLPLEARGNHHR